MERFWVSLHNWRGGGRDRPFTKQTNRSDWCKPSIFGAAVEGGSAVRLAIRDVQEAFPTADTAQQNTIGHSLRFLPAVCGYAHMYLANFSSLRRVLLLHRYLHPASPRRSRDGLGRETGGCSGRGLPRSREDPERLRRALERSRCRQWRMPCAPADDAPYGPCGKQLYGIQLRKSFDVDRRCLRIFHRRRWTSFSTIFGLLQQRIT